MKVKSCPTLCNPMDCSLPGFSIHGILQARILEWVAISFSGGSFWPRDQTRVSLIVGRHFITWATREVLTWYLWLKMFPGTLVAGKKSAFNEGDPDSILGLGSSPREEIGYPLQCSWASLVADGTQSTCNVRDLCLIPRLGRSPGEGNDNPLQYSCLENPMDWGAWWATVHGMAKYWTWLSD